MRIIRKEAVDHVIHAWLKAEWIKHGYDKSFPQYQNLVDHPEFDDLQQNAIRLQLLRQTRVNILAFIPADTVWYVAAFEQDDLGRTYHIASADWLPITNGTYQLSNTLLNFDSQHEHASWIRELHATLPNPVVDPKPIIIGSSLHSPMSIIEGNHRASALLKYDEVNPSGRLLTEVHLGVSPSMGQNHWHIEHPRNRYTIQ